MAKQRLKGYYGEITEKQFKGIYKAAVRLKGQEQVTRISYPVLHYPDKIKTYNFDKERVVKGTLEGIKGQYLILDLGVLNIRKFAGYEISFTVC